MKLWSGKLKKAPFVVGQKIYIAVKPVKNFNEKFKVGDEYTVLKVTYDKGGCSTDWMITAKPVEGKRIIVDSDWFSDNGEAAKKLAKLRSNQ